MSGQRPQPSRADRSGGDQEVRGSFSLGRIAGVRVGVNWSVLVIFGLIAYLLAGVRFPARYPGYGTVAYVGAGLLAAVIFLASLLVHEISHALVARRNGQRVEGITLWLFGGVARLQGEARTPAAEVRVAGVGPLVSLGLGFFFVGVAMVLAAVGIGGLVAGAVVWLGLINIALAVFNSVPAAPLDGGRLLRAVLWWLTKDANKATLWASRAGQGFGWILVALGVFSLLSPAAFGTLWLAVIGWFLISAASLEGQQASVRARLSGVPVWQVMTPDPVTVSAAMTVQEFFDHYFVRHRHAAFPVLGEDNEPVGLVTLERITAVANPARDNTVIGDICIPLSQVTRASPEDSVAGLLPELSERSDRRALVFAGQRLTGIVSPRDVNRALERISLLRRDRGT